MRSLALKAANTGKAPVNKWLLILLLIAIILTLWAAFISDEINEDDSIVVAERKPALAGKPNNDADIKTRKQSNNDNNLSANKGIKSNSDLIPWQLLNREPLDNNEKLGTKTINIFKVHSWLEVPRATRPAPVQIVPPIKPVAPVAPFTYMGQMLDTPKGTQVFLISNNVLVSVVEGEKINQLWRFDKQDENSLRLTYLPLNLPQVLFKSAPAADPLATDPTLDPNQLNAGQQNANQLNPSSLNTDPPESGELGLEELKL